MLYLVVDWKCIPIISISYGNIDMEEILVNQSDSLYLMLDVSIEFFARVGAISLAQNVLLQQGEKK